uniref:methyl-accepting chemotaxis protein n=1 Tax=Ningiella ruwaisensis TaxID=2364274 RepID=UPI00109EF090|nr:methyl-accepting chemotaxis protein [Ningiella ruwaisensis]
MTLPWLEKGNHVYRGVLIFQFVLTLFIGYVTDSLLLGLGAGIFILSLPLAMFSLAKDAALTRHAAVIATQLFAALHIQQTGGVTFMHFEIFAVMAVTTVYRDWKVVLSSVLVVAFHHIGFYALQVNGSPVYIFEQNYLTLYILAIHALFAISEGIVLAFISIQSRKEAMSALELSDAIHQIMKDKDAFDLSVRTSKTSKSLAEFNTLIDAFSSFIGQTKSVADSIADVSDEIDLLSKEMKQASFNTSGQVSTIAAATEEMTANNDDVAERANNVNRLSSDAKESSVKAKSVVVRSNQEVSSLQKDLGTTSDAIVLLSEKCHQIESFMASIKAISEQTNLLALNAAIESARAGEHGRGFAVVADEVRQLAMRTKENTEQISEITADLIQVSNASVEKMKSCVEKSSSVSNSSDSAKTIIDTVAQHISSVSEQMLSVASAIEEQSIASSEISKSTNMLANTSEELSENAEKTDASFNALSAQIRALRQELARFK